MHPSHIAHHLLRAPRQLTVYRARAAKHLQAGKNIDERLLDEVTKDPDFDRGLVALHQIEGARELFLQRRERHGPERPLVVAALCTLARSLLVFFRGELMFRPDGHLLWREQWSGRTLLEPIRAAATHLRCLEGDLPFDWGPRAPRSPWHTEAPAPLLPPVADPDILRLRAQGLTEVHRHANLMRLPTHIWLHALYADVADLEESPRIAYPTLRALRQGRALTRALDALLHANPTDQSACEQARQEARQALESDGTEVHYKATEPLPEPHGASAVSDEVTRNAHRLAADRDRMERALRRLMDPNLCIAQDGDTELLGYVFHAWLICRHHVEMSGVQHPENTRGLDRFKKDYVDHPWSKTYPLGVASWWKQAFEEGGVHHLELKIGPGFANPAKIEPLLDAIRKHSTNTPPDDAAAHFARVMGAVPSAVAADAIHADIAGQRPGLRIVIHFLRVDDSSKREKFARARFDNVRQQTLDSAEQLRLVAEEPRFGPMFVGIDIASFELATPAEVFAPAFRLLRAPWAIQRQRPNALGQAVHQFGISAHAGEEFEHIVGGMRQVDEHIRFLGMGRGDRIGHGLALGLDPRAWRRQTGGGVSQRRQNRLDDLVWLHHKLSLFPHHAHLCHRLRDQIGPLCQTIYSVVAEPMFLYEAWTMRDILPGSPDDCSPEPVGPGATPIFPNAWTGALHHERQKRLTNASEVAKKLWWKYTFDATTWEKGQERIATNDTREWDEPLREVQNEMLREMALQDIAIEANPSSNLAIASLTHMSNHPVFRWLPVRAAERSAQPMPRICVGSDDPAIFCTELVHEYALLAEAARQQGHTPNDIRSWLDELKQNGDDLAFPVSGR